MDKTDPCCEYITIQKLQDKKFKTDNHGGMKSNLKHKIKNEF